MSEIKEGYTRVSSILSPFSGLDKIDPAVVQNAAERGTRVHNNCFTKAKGEIPFFEKDEDWGYFNSFNKWFLPDDYLIEQRFYHDDLMLTGEVDMIKKHGDGHIIYDLKTSSKPSLTWPLQGAAYSCLLENAGIKVEKIQFIHLMKDGKPPKIYEYSAEEYLPMFMKCYDVCKYFKLIKEKK